MIQYRETASVQKEIEKITCNMCGNDIGRNSFGYFDESVHVEKTWGYGSEKDGETHAFDLCEECYNKLISGFKIKP